MKHFVTLIRGNAGSDWHGGPGFTTAPGDAPPIKKYPPVLSVPDPLKPRLKTDKQAAAEARDAAQRELIDGYKAKHPSASPDRMFAELTQQHPDVFRDDDGDDDEDGTGSDAPSDEKRRLDAKREVFDHFRGAFPELPVDEVFRRIARLNPEFSED
jgi:hypothetical protein